MHSSIFPDWLLILRLLPRCFRWRRQATSWEGVSADAQSFESMRMEASMAEVEVPMAQACWTDNGG